VDSFIRKHEVNYEEIDQKVWKSSSALRATGSTMLLRLPMTSPLAPQAEGAGASSKMEISRVRKTYWLIKMTSVSLLKSMWKGMALLMVTVWVRG
jgi:hypothetical protein